MQAEVENRPGTIPASGSDHPSVVATATAAVTTAPPAAAPAVAAWPAPRGRHEKAWLLGQPPLEGYVDAIEADTAEPTPDRAGIVAQWRAVNDLYGECERTEAGAAELASVRALPDVLLPLVDAVQAHSFYRRHFTQLPTSIEMVDLSRLIAYQTWLDRAHVDRLIAQIGPEPAPMDLFHGSFPLEPPRPAVEIERLGEHRVLIRSAAPTLRAHEFALLTGEVLDAIRSYGPVAACLSLPIGINANLMNVIRYGNRWLLHNGYHRACALLALGVTQVPCIVQRASRYDELDLALGRRLSMPHDFYFEAPRPPLVRDFLDPRFVRVLPMRARTRVIDISLDVREYVVTA